MIKIKSEILNRLFLKELQQLISKYNDIDSSTQEVIEAIMNHIDDEELVEYLLNNPNKLNEAVIAIKTKDIDMDIISFFIWYNSEIKDISIESTINNYEVLDTNGYIEIEEYLIYRNDKHLKEYAREVLESKLDDEYFIDRVFDKEMIIDFWINKTDKYEVMEEILQNDDLEEVLDINPEYSFKVSSGIEYKYSIIEY
ncbi:TPA: hypothetical protein ACKONR_001181 [Clostridioides difficile]|uniref:hypothetical protein n=1 Tax=Clostridioides difficile TaxID=1496 RepID=UPI0009800C70|nr:hypothetical protein [Clostridioides difficile]AXU29196.1 hypothetical protein CDIF102859_03533 [Clostridioides difficile]AXU32984.1 hypothetical protein CDIF102860_03548 [Clostridioides difficile]AXU36772.1 hypothetical protein CDIF102978_03548 [Clostridioides difficile]MCP8413126.1 hypothetical protein [Clostridioides difficile]MDC9390861.1 hypothetical protein [Clostridioides difficile]